MAFLRSTHNLSDFCFPNAFEYLKELTFKSIYLSNNDLEMFLRSPQLDLSTGVCGIDIETYPTKGWEAIPGAALKPYASRIRCIQIWDGSDVVILDFMTPDGENLLHENRNVLGSVCSVLQNGVWAAHNAQFEVNNFVKLQEMNGIPAELLIYCTMNAYNLILQAADHKWEQYEVNLQAVSRRVLGINVDKEIDHTRWAEATQFDAEQIRYCALDAVLPKLLLDVMHENLDELGMINFFKLDAHIKNPIAHMHLFGNPIDAKLHDQLIEKWQKEFDVAKEECFELLNQDLGFKNPEEGREYVLKGIPAKRVAVVTKWLDEVVVDEDWQYAATLVGLQRNAKECAEEYRDTDEGARRAFNKIASNIEELLYNPGSDKQLSDWMKLHIDQEILDEWPITDGSAKYVAKCQDEKADIDKEKIRLKMDSETFEDLGDIEGAEPITRFKKYSKLLSTYGHGLKNFYVQLPWEQGPTVHANYSTCRTETGRLSTYKPSVQQVPRPDKDPDVRKIFSSGSKDYVILSADFSQIELRIQALLTQDPVMLAVYDEGGDIHDTTAERILSHNGTTRELVTPEEWQKTRDVSKNCNFACVYGGGASAVKKQGRKSGNKHPLHVWQGFVDAYRETYVVAREWQLQHAESCKHSLKVTIPYGKVASLHPDYAFTQSLNFPVQGAGFVIMAFALVNIYRVYCERRDLDFKFLKSVHDSIDLRVYKDHVEEVRDIVRECMERAMLTLFPEATTLKLVDIKTGPSWGELKKS